MPLSVNRLRWKPALQKMCSWLFCSCVPVLSPFRAVRTLFHLHSALLLCSEKEREPACPQRQNRGPRSRCCPGILPTAFPTRRASFSSCASLSFSHVSVP